jgi:hypothetical protein
MGKIVSKFLFLPPKNIYQIDDSDLFLKTTHNNIIQVKVIDRNAKFYLLVSHGNAEDIYSVYDWAVSILLPQVNVNVVMYGIYILFRI